ncbi:MAG TPA: hypothetical protein VJ602_04305 [Paludibacter sp.]|nr:hypothetical protein [Paludibacter sp.]
MEDEKDYECKKRHYYHHHQSTASGGAVYGLGFIGAAVFFLLKATSFWVGVVGILKALVWPAFLVFYALRALGA